MQKNNSTQTVLCFDEVTFRREGKEILKGINWSVREGERWALLGLNGAGKSTLLSLIPAIQVPTTGRVSVLGQEFGKCVWQEVKEKVGFVSSTLKNFEATLKKQTVEKVVLSGATNTIGLYRENTEAEKEVAAKLMDLFSIIHVADNRFSTLSSGERRRALLARAIMSNPSLLILDEPCSGLDMKGREKFLHILENLNLQQQTLPCVYVTHQIEEIIPSITHVAILQAGKIVAQGLKAEVITEDVLSNLYEVPLKIIWNNGRPWVIVK